jgi:phosphate:Na+ symporter
LFLLDNLESIADTIKSMGSQSAKRIDAGITFSEEGAKELLGMHKDVTGLLCRLARALKEEGRESMVYIATVSLEIAKGDEKLKLSHFHRLMSGKPESESSTTIHMELLNMLGQVNSRIGVIARRLSPAVFPYHTGIDDFDYTSGGD